MSTYGFTMPLSDYLARLVTPAKRDYAEAYANGLVKGFCVPDPSYFGLAADKVAKVQAQVRKFSLVTPVATPAPVKATPKASKSNPAKSRAWSFAAAKHGAGTAECWKAYKAIRAEQRKLNIAV